LTGQQRTENPVVRRIRIAAVAASVSVALVLAGCASKTAGVANPATGAGAGQATVTTTQSKSSSGGDAVEFADQVCLALMDFIQPAMSIAGFQPDVSTPAAAVESIKGVLDKMSTGLDASLASLSKIDPGGVDGGDKLLTAFTDAFTQVKQKLQTATSKLGAVDPNDPSSVATAMQEVGTELTSVADIQTTFETMDTLSPELNRAGNEAPTCKKIEELGSSGSIPTS
jgi:hypothetical protein